MTGSETDVRGEIRDVPQRAAGTGDESAVARGPGGRFVTIALDPQLQGRFAEIAAGRVLVIDYLVTHPTADLLQAELSARLQRPRPRGAVKVASVEGVDCLADPRVHTVLRDGGPNLRPVAGAVLGQLEIELAQPLIWFDFLSSVAARQP
jgi:hypothetical protein